MIFTLIKVNVACFVGKQGFLIMYATHNTK